MKIDIYTDGACRVHTSKTGGWAYSASIDVGKDVPIEIWDLGAEKNSTSNRMELTAIMEAMKFLWHSNLLGHNITIFSDSQYSVKGCNLWLKGWIKRGFISSQDKEIKNRDLWVKVNSLIKCTHPKIEWIRGHDGCPGNERVDKLAVIAAEQYDEV